MCRAAAAPPRLASSAGWRRRVPLGRNPSLMLGAHASATPPGNDPGYHYPIRAMKERRDEEGWRKMRRFGLVFGLGEKSGIFESKTSRKNKINPGGKPVLRHGELRASYHPAALKAQSSNCICRPRKSPRKIYERFGGRLQPEFIEERRVRHGVRGWSDGTSQWARQESTELRAVGVKHPCGVGIREACFSALAVVCQGTVGATRRFADIRLAGLEHDTRPRLKPNRLRRRLRLLSAPKLSSVASILASSPHSLRLYPILTPILSSNSLSHKTQVGIMKPIVSSAGSTIAVLARQQGHGLVQVRVHGERELERPPAAHRPHSGTTAT
ncbi:hypothetical protein DFH06DRAFT_1132073 [Mycena polygramma]|nr:hypothetical protein DFH06DRAFT_1132073 [Mycena polygramma]